MNASHGLPPAKQMQSEESLPALDDEERKAVQNRARDRLAGRSARMSSPTVQSSARPLVRAQG